MNLKKGSKSKEVVVVQNALHLYPDGIFGTLTEDAVKMFQKANGLAVDGIVGDKTWEKLTASNYVKSKRIINEIIIHCSATKDGQDFTVDDITKWHKQRGFSTIGYHYVIYRDGTIHSGRDVNVSGAHCVNHNAHSIGICYIGGCSAMSGTPKDTRTSEQKASMLKLLKDLRKIYPNAKIRGHRDFAKKACPSFDATKEYNVI